MRKTITSPWHDLGVTTGEPAPSIRRPINIKRSLFAEPRQMMAGDELTVKFTALDERGRVLSKDVTPRFEIDRDIVVDSITKFEVIDEFGVDVGIGFVLGQAKPAWPR